MTVRLTSGVILVLILIGVPFFFAFRHLLESEQIAALTDASAGMSRVMVDGLRTSMLAGKPRLMHEAVRNLARQEEVERVLILDHEGGVRVSSDERYEGKVLDRNFEDVCTVCHTDPQAPPPAVPSSSRR